MEIEPLADQADAGEVVLRFGPGGIVALGDEFAGERRVPRGEWIRIGQARLRVRPASDLLEEGEVNSANWTRPELLVSTLDGGHVRRLRSVLPTDEGDDVLIGRSNKKNDIVLSDEHVSRRHVRIVVRGGRHMVEDLGSRWGTFVNDVRVEGAVPLAHGDEIRLGKSIMRFVKFSDGLDFATSDGQTSSMHSHPKGPSWRPDPGMDESMTITATTLLTLPDQASEQASPAPVQPVRDEASVSQKLKGWMRKKK